MDGERVAARCENLFTWEIYRLAQRGYSARTHFEQKPYTASTQRTLTVLMVLVIVQVSTTTHSAATHPAASHTSSAASTQRRQQCLPRTEIKIAHAPMPRM